MTQACSSGERGRPEPAARGRCGASPTPCACLVPLSQGGFKWHQYQVVGRHLPTERTPVPTVYRMKVWAEDSVKAKSKFWCVRAWSSAAVAIAAIMGDAELNGGPAGTWVARRRPSLPRAPRYFLKKLRRVKKANGQILSVNEVRRERRDRERMGIKTSRRPQLSNPPGPAFEELRPRR